MLDLKFKAYSPGFLNFSALIKVIIDFFFDILVAYNGQEIPVHNYEILCNGNVHWIPSSHGQAHPNAVQGGRTSSGEILYVGRAHHQGSVTPGKIHPSHRTLYIPYGGVEIAVSSYEILVEY